MAHALVMKVKLLDGGNPDDNQKMLDEFVVPLAKSQAGFKRGLWMRDENNHGLGVIVFASAEEAGAAKDVLKPPPGGPELLSATVFEVGAEA